MKNKIKEIREALGVSQAELCRRASLEQSALSRMESGNHVLRPATLRRLAAALELSSWVQLLPEEVERALRDEIRVRGAILQAEARDIGWAGFQVVAP